MRKVIQISSDSGNNDPVGPWASINALCDDGSMWEINAWGSMEGREWMRLPDIPQDDEGGDQ